MSFYSSEITLTKNQLVREAAHITFQNIELLHETCLQYYKGKNSNNIIKLAGAVNLLSILGMCILSDLPASSVGKSHFGVIRTVYLEICLSSCDGIWRGHSLAQVIGSTRIRKYKEMPVCHVSLHRYICHTFFYLVHFCFSAYGSGSSS